MISLSRVFFKPIEHVRQLFIRLFKLAVSFKSSGTLLEEMVEIHALSLVGMAVVAGSLLFFRVSALGCSLPVQLIGAKGYSHGSLIPFAVILHVKVPEDGPRSKIHCLGWGARAQVDWATQWTCVQGFFGHWGVKGTPRNQLVKYEAGATRTIVCNLFSTLDSWGTKLPAVSRLEMPSQSLTRYCSSIVKEAKTPKTPSSLSAAKVKFCR